MSEHDLPPPENSYPPEKVGRQKARFSIHRIAWALRKGHGLVSTAAALVPCSTSVIYTALKKHPKLYDIIQQAREDMVDTAELSLRRRILDGEGWAVLFALRTQGRKRGYIEKVEQEISTTPGSAPLSQVTVNIQQIVQTLMGREDLITHAQDHTSALYPPTDTTRPSLESCLIGSQPSVPSDDSQPGQMAPSAASPRDRPGRYSVHSPKPNGNGKEPHPDP